MYFVFCFIESKLSSLSVKIAHKLYKHKFSLQNLALLSTKLLEHKCKYQYSVWIFLRTRDRCVPLYEKKNFVNGFSHFLDADFVYLFAHMLFTLFVVRGSK